MIDSNDPEEIDRIIRDGIPDPVGSFYRFSLAASHLRRRRSQRLQSCNVAQVQMQLCTHSWLLI